MISDYFERWRETITRRGAPSEQLAAAIEDLIVRRLLAPGEKLMPERELAELLHLSRSTVREAIHELELKGLVSRRQGRGTQVRQTTTTDLQMLGALTGTERTAQEVLDLRAAIEPQVVVRAANRATASDLLLLEQVLNASEADLTPEKSADLDRQFHAGVAMATRNPLLIAVIDTTADWIADIRLRSHQTVAGRAQSVAGHREILAAIEAHDPAAALKAMEQHLLTVSTASDVTDLSPISGKSNKIPIEKDEDNR